MPKEYFLDESGSTGDIVSEKIYTVLKEQPVFTLCALGFESSNYESIYNDINFIIKKYNIQSLELKSKEICKKNRKKVLKDIIDIIIKNKCHIYIDIVDKKYSICGTLCEYYIFTPYLEDDNMVLNQRYCELKRVYTDKIYENLNKNIINDFIYACDPSDIENSLFYIQKCFKNIKYMFEKDYILPIIKQSRSYFLQIKNISHKLAQKRFTPLKSIKNEDGDKGYTLLPHLSSFASICARINKKENEFSNIDFIHDKQKEFSPFILEVKEFLEKNNLQYANNIDDYNFNKINLFFKDSKDDICIQLSDILSGIFMRLFKDLYTEEKEFEHLIDIVADIKNNISFSDRYLVPQKKLDFYRSLFL